MQTSNHARMMGAHPGTDAPPLRTFARRRNRRYEADLLAYDLADEATLTDLELDEIDAEHNLYVDDDLYLGFTAEDVDYLHVSEDEWDEAWAAYDAFVAAEAAAERAERLARYQPDDTDSVCGWGAPTVYEPAGDWRDNSLYDLIDILTGA